MLQQHKLYLSAGVSFVAGLIPLGMQSALALPPPAEIPEEVLRTEIIIEARSPIDGKPLTAAEYAQLQAQLQQRRATPQLNAQVKQTILLLRLRQLIRTVVPFLP